MGLDRLYRLGAALNDVGVDGALTQEAHAFDLGGFFGEDVDEFVADDLALGLGVGFVSQQLEVAVGGVDVDQVGVELVLEDLDDLLGFALAHQAVVHVHADELLADGLDQQRGNDGRVDAAGKGQQHLAVAHLLPDGLDRFVDEGVGQFGRGDAHHVVRALIGSEIHGSSIRVRLHDMPHCTRQMRLFGLVTKQARNIFPVASRVHDEGTAPAGGEVPGAHGEGVARVGCAGIPPTSL